MRMLAICGVVGDRVVAPRAGGIRIQIRYGPARKLVSILVDEYDRTHNAQPKRATALAVLELLVEEHGISGRELGKILGNEAAGGFILRGERHITVEQAKKLGARFSVDPSVFLDL